jgi:hypothetical protein
VDGETAGLSNNDPVNEFARWAGHAIMANSASKYMEDVMRSGEEWLIRHPNTRKFIEELPYHIVSALPLPGPGPEPVVPYVPYPKRWGPPPFVAPPTAPKPEGSPIQEPRKPPLPDGPPKVDLPKPGDDPPKVVRIPLSGFEPFVRSFGDFILEANPHGRGRPGNELTKKSNLILLKACQDAAADRYYILKHIAGANKPEVSLTGPTPNSMTGRSFPDITFDVTHQGGRITRVLLNTVTTLANGITPDSRERRGLAQLNQNAAAPRNIVTGPNLVGDFPKLRTKDGKPPDQAAEENYERAARQYCDGILDRAERLLLKEMLNLSPD